MSSEATYQVRDWIEIHREYERQIVEAWKLAFAARGTTTTRERTMGVWIAGHNMPGYLPESEPAGFETFEAAKQYMIDTLDRHGDDDFEMGDAHRESDPELSARLLDEADELSGVMEDLNLASEGDWGTIVGNTSYWITYDPDQSVEDFEDEQ